MYKNAATSFPPDPAPLEVADSEFGYPSRPGMTMDAGSNENGQD